MSKENNSNILGPYCCALCGKTYQDFDAYASCVQKCAQQRRKEEAEEKKRLLELERKSRNDEIADILKSAQDKIKSYIKDYGAIEIPISDGRTNFMCGRAPSLYDILNALI